MNMNNNKIIMVILQDAWILPDYDANKFNCNLDSNGIDLQGTGNLVFTTITYDDPNKLVLLGSKEGPVWICTNVFWTTHTKIQT